MAEKAAAKKRLATARDAPPPKKSKGFTNKKKKPSRPVPKVVISIPAKDDPPVTEEMVLVTYDGPVILLFPLILNNRTRSFNWMGPRVNLLSRTRL